MELDHINGNTLWSDAIKKEMDSLGEYQVFNDLGYKASIPNGYK